jgi:protein pelota
MKKLHQDLKKGEIKLRAENLNDLWALSQIIEPGDLISGKTFRKIKIGGETDRNQKVIRKPMHLKIEAEKVELDNGMRRINGKVREGPEDVALGSYHSFSIEDDSTLMIIKKEWFSYQLDKIKESMQDSNSKILLVVMDREDASFAMLENYGYTYLSSIHGNVAKKDVEQNISGNFYSDLIKAMEEYDKRYGLTHIILGSPSFWKEDLLKVMPAELSRKTVPATCSDVGKSAFDELLKRDEVQKALKAERVSKEVEAVEEFLALVAKDGNVTYGFDEVMAAADMGAVSQVLVSEALIWKMRENGDYLRLENILKTVEKNKGKVLIVSKEHEAGKKLEGISGIGAILRYKV